mmetsp:Transcript_43888/g.105898  ORF Transcript_43888/g.105898 Transcript_43888/m.105898 type:complete len:293 (-) Transcript_43888:75-953(-)
MIVSWKIIDQRVHNQETENGSPQAFHANEQERWTWNIHRHDLLFKHELHGLDNSACHNQNDTQQGVARFIFVIVFRFVEDGSSTDQEDSHDVPKDSHPLKAEQVITQNMLLHQCHKNNTRPSQQLVDTNIDVLKSHHTKCCRRQIEDGRNGQEKVHPNWKLLCTRRFFLFLLDKRVGFLINGSICFGTRCQTLCLVGRLVGGMNITWKWNLEGNNHFVHHQTKHHTDKHSKCLKDWLLKHFLFTGNSFAMKFHHGFGADGTSCSTNNCGQEDQQLGKSTFLGGVASTTHYCL